MNTCQYLRLHMKIICWRFHSKAPSSSWDMSTWGMWKVCLQTLRNNRICWKLAYFLRNLRTLRINNSKILRVKNAKFSGYCFYINTNIYGDFEICISVPLKGIFFFQLRLSVAWIELQMLLKCYLIYMQTSCTGKLFIFTVFMSISRPKSIYVVSM